MKNSSNLKKYRLLSKIYDFAFDNLLKKSRVKALTMLNFTENQKILIVGIGTGLDLEYIPDSCYVTGVDISEEMLSLAKQKSINRKNTSFKEMNAENLEFDTGSYDVVILSLILSVVEKPSIAFNESLRVLNKEGVLLVYDKFVEGKISLGRRFLNIFTSAVGTDINRSFNKISEGSNITVHEDRLVSTIGNYRSILISKNKG